jgi:AraC family transcriptional regulator
MNDTLERIQRAIDFVEARLFDDLPLAAVAAEAGCSPWHFHRLFAAVTGETPANYVRRRRLSETCRRLVETDVPLVDIALDCGFESQATFTRAFTRQVGMSPARFRRTRRFSLPAYRYPALDLAALVARRRRRESMEPRIVERPAFHLIGMAERFTPATTSRIPELWARFVPRIADVPDRVGGHTFGVCVDADPATIEDAGFRYVAAVEVARAGVPPDGLIALAVPASRYAVFTHTGHVSRVGDTVKQVWGTWLPASGYRTLAAPDFELYDPARWDPSTGEGEVDYYVPVA